MPARTKRESAPLSSRRAPQERASGYCTNLCILQPVSVARPLGLGRENDLVALPTSRAASSPSASASICTAAGSSSSSPTSTTRLVRWHRRSKREKVLVESRERKATRRVKRFLWEHRQQVTTDKVRLQTSLVRYRSVKVVYVVLGIKQLLPLRDGIVQIHLLLSLFLLRVFRVLNVLLRQCLPRDLPFRSRRGRRRKCSEFDDE